MGGPSSTENSQNNLATQQTNILQQEQQQSQQNTARALNLEQPDISFLQGITSGNKSSLLQSLGPQLSNLSAAKAATSAQINDSTGPGAARDIAQATNIQQSNTGVANLENTAYTGAFGQLANIGAGFGSTALSDIGAAISAGNSAGTTLSSVAGEQAQGKSATLGFLGQLAGAAAGGAGTALSGK